MKSYLNACVIVFVGCASLGPCSAVAQNTLDEFIYNTMKLTPARNHSSEFVPGALIEVPLNGKNTRWQVVDYREKEKRGIHPPTVEELTATQDPFQVNKPTNIKIGLDSIKQVFGGASITASANFKHEVTVSEIKEKGYVLADTEDQDLLKSGKLHDWLLLNYITHPRGDVAYFIIKRVYTAQYAEINVDRGFDVGAALGGKDTGTCAEVQLPAALSNTTQGGGTQGGGTQGGGTQGGAQGSGTQGSGTQQVSGAQGGGTQGGGTQGSGTQGGTSTIHVGGSYCHPDKEHVRFYASEWAPLAVDVEFITRINDTLDVKPGVVFLPLYDSKKTANIAKSLF